MISTAVRFLPAVAPAIASMLLAGGPARAQGVHPSHPGWEESGEASWYGGRHNGRRMSNGAAFDDTQLTAAHASLPLGTKVRVTMQDTGASVVVTVTDRQPPKYVRVIDLSRGAASRIGLLSRGTAMVTLNRTRADEPVEVAEATDGDVSVEGFPDEGPISGGAPRRRGRPHTRHAARAASADRPCCRAPSVIQVRRSVQRPAAQHRL